MEGISNGRLRVATFNIKHGAQPDGYRGNPELTADSCTRLRADIIALQEVDRGAIRSGWADMAALAAKASGMDYRFAKTMNFTVGSYGNALLVRGEIEDYEVYGLGGGSRFRKRVKGHELHWGHEPRAAILATAHVGERRISVAATHLSTQRELNRIQLPTVIEALLERPAPHVLLGDLNMTRAKAFPFFEEAGMELIDNFPTYPATNPSRTIDHIAVSGLKACMWFAPRMEVSDHKAAVLEVE